MTKTNPKAAEASKPAAAVAPNFELIPLSKLTLSPKNVRKVPASPEADAELYASIKETGLKQNLLVHKVGAKFHVHAGGRRLAALQRLKEDGHIKAGHKVPCHIEDPDLAEDTSTAENMVRAAMHAADQFEAFAALRAKGRTEDQIAAQFGITTSLVVKRLKLASVSPEIMQIFRDGGMSLDCVTAFTLTDDHARQIDAWEAVRKQYNPGAHAIRNHLTQQTYSGASKLAKFVGVGTYKDAGGTVIEDLFSDRGNTHLEDPDLLERLADDKLADLAKVAAKTWKWAEPMRDVDYDSFRPFGRVYPQALPSDPTLDAEYDKLQARQTELEEDYDEETWTEALQEEEEKVWGRLREIDDIRAANVAFTDEDHKIAGCVVTISHAGEPTYHEGLVRPEDIPPQTADPEDKTEGDREEDAPAAPTIELPQSMRASASAVPVDATTAARKAQGIPQALADDLRATRHQILQAHLAADYATAFDVMLYAMARAVIGRGSYLSPLDQSLRPAMTHGSSDALKDTVAAHMLDQMKESLNLAWADVEAPEDFAALCALSEVDKQALFAWCTAYGLKQQLGNDSRANPVLEAIGARLSIDVASCWRPGADTYWARVKKDHALEIGKTLIGETWADERSGLRKPELAKAMDQAFSDNPVESAGLTPETAARTARWLPDGMAFAEQSDATEDVADASADTEQALPDYLNDAA